MRARTLAAIGGVAACAVAACGSSSSTTSSSGGGQGGGGQAGGGGNYCSLARAVRDAQGQVNVLSTATAVADEKSALGDIVAKVDAAAAAAPSDVSSDWGTVKSFFDLINGVVQTATDTAQAQSAILGLSTNSAASTASAALDAAGKRIDAYTQSHCGFTISTPTPGAAQTSTESSSSSAST